MDLKELEKRLCLNNEILYQYSKTMIFSATDIRQMKKISRLIK